MPIYDFRCKSCDKTWSILIGMDEYTDTEDFTCEHCGEEQDKQSRQGIGEGLSTTVRGVGKGNHNSSDWS